MDVTATDIAMWITVSPDADHLVEGAAIDPRVLVRRLRLADGVDTAHLAAIDNGDVTPTDIVDALQEM